MLMSVLVWRGTGWYRLILTLDREHHALADVGADPVAGLAQVVTPVLLQDVPDQQRPVGHELDPTGQRNRVVLLRVPYSTGEEQNRVRVREREREREEQGQDRGTGAGSGNRGRTRDQGRDHGCVCPRERWLNLLFWV